MALRLLFRKNETENSQNGKEVFQSLKASYFEQEIEIE